MNYVEHINSNSLYKNEKSRLIPLIACERIKQYIRK